MKVDLHVHSKHSKRPSEWILKQLSCPESFTEPMEVFRAARQKGMGLVTLTDHNTIDGCLEIAHLPDVFISEEVTTYFPHDQCKLHVLVYDIDEAIHRDIQKVRENVFDLCKYLNERRIVHVLAHPLYSVNRKLTIDRFETALLLFECFELNGARSELQNQLLQNILRHLTPATIDRLSEKHGIVPAFKSPWEKNLSGGSDDHGGLTIARRYTEVEGEHDRVGFFRGVVERRCRVVGEPSTPQTLARTIYSVAYRFYENKLNLNRFAHTEIAFKLLDGFLQTNRTRDTRNWSLFDLLWVGRNGFRSNQGQDSNILSLLRDETHKMIGLDPQLSDLARNGGDKHDLDQRWFHFVNDLSNSVMGRFAHHVVDSLAGANLFNIFDSLGSAGALYFVLAPYFVAFSTFSEERRFSRSVARSFQVDQSTSRNPHDGIRVAHFTDTLHEVNGVAESLKKQIAASKRMGVSYTVLSCQVNGSVNGNGMHHFEPIGVYDVPVYPEQKLFYPPFLEVVDYCYRHDFTHIHAATPGPLGLAALAAARILKLPVIGTYHTALPEYARLLTEDADMEELVWKYVLWFYDQMDCVFVPSKAFAHELNRRGLSPGRIRIFPRGVDTQRFHPARRNGIVDASFGRDYRTKLVYVGRVSKEKNLPLLVNVFRRLVETVKDVSLVIVGDGPYRQVMQEALEGTPCLFTGYLEADSLAPIYASCDLFVFPSTTDTFGNVVLEAQASGLPVVVTDQGGPQENMVAGETGLVVQGNDEAGFLTALKDLVAAPAALKRMGQAARQYAESRSFDAAFAETWKMYGDVTTNS
ncbi:MAG: glycosyltransferase [Desulfomonile tiedjei]|nr:glycosyltransferase [Desulfomonile tiedjei]